MPLVSFDGINCSGKSTVISGLVSQLGAEIAVVRQPSELKHGQAARSYMAEASLPDPLVEFGMLVADRAVLVNQQILPSLAAGHLVLSDRYYYSHAYQAVAGLPFESLLAVNRRLFPHPDKALWLDVPVDTAMDRISDRGRVGDPDRATLVQVRHKFEELERKGAMTRIDASLSVDAVLSSVLTEVESLIVK